MKSAIIMYVTLPELCPASDMVQYPAYDGVAPHRGDPIIGIARRTSFSDSSWSAAAYVACISVAREHLQWVPRVAVAFAWPETLGRRGHTYCNGTRDPGSTRIQTVALYDIQYLRYCNVECRQDA